MRPTTLVIHDNLQKKIFFIKNCFSDKKISNYEKKYNQIQDELNNIIIQSKISASYSDKKLVKKTIKSNISIKQFLKNGITKSLGNKHSQLFSKLFQKL